MCILIKQTCAVLVHGGWRVRALTLGSFCKNVCGTAPGLAETSSGLEVWRAADGSKNDSLNITRPLPASLSVGVWWCLTLG